MSRETREQFGPVVVRTLAWVGMALLLLAVGFAWWVILPKYEASWNDRGIRPPLLGRWLVSLSHAVMKYCWIFPVAGFAIWAVRSRPRAVDRRPMD